MKLALATLLTLTTSIGALAQRHFPGAGERIQLHLNDHLRGQNTLYLKRLIKQQNPYINLKTAKLKSVTLVAKSRHGRGEAVLDVGPFSSYPMTIMGNPRMFNRPGPRTFSRLHLFNPSRSSTGKWQVQLRGNIKVKKVVVEIQSPHRVRTVRLVVEQDYRGHGVIPLKRLIRNQNPRLNVTDLEIESVTLLAKSMRGRAQASLVVGRSEGLPSTIGGNPRAFRMHHPSTFHMTYLQAPYVGGTNGRWQVQLNGVIKVKEVILTLKSKSEPDNGGFGGGRRGRRGRRGQ